mgnify:CR=1 FL=1
MTSTNRHSLQSHFEPPKGGSSAKKASVSSAGGEYDSAYVFELENNCDRSLMACSLSTQDICIYDTATFTEVSCIRAHSDRINGIEFAKLNPSLLVSTSDDNNVKLWDVRIPGNTPVFGQTLEDEILDASLGSSDNLLACACGMGVSFYDIRQISSSTGCTPQKLGEYTDVHTDTISQVKFHPERSMELVTGSEDGLICIFNTQVPEGEGAIVSILNTECPVRRVGYFGQNFDGLYCLSTIESVSVWHSTSAQRIAHFPEIRTDLDLDYLVDCNYDPSTDSLQVIGGDNNGIGHLISINPFEVKKLSSFDNGHHSTIRCAIGMGNATQFITGGEDGRVCIWNGVEQEQKNVGLASSSNAHHRQHSSHSSAQKKMKKKNREKGVHGSNPY